MEAVNGVSEGGPPPPSPLTGCYLLVVIGEPHSQEHKDLILRRVAKGLLSWDLTNCLVDLEKELTIITDQAPDGEEARYGERLIQYASENLVTEILIHPAVSTLSQCVRNLLSSFTRHRHIIHSGYTFAANGSWALQDGTFSLADFSEAFQEIEVQRVIRAYENSISVDIHCSPEGDWPRLSKEPFAKSCKLRLNPVDVLPLGSSSITNFLNYISPFLLPLDIETALESSEVVGNIRFSHPTLYVFPGGQGDAALFGINGFNMLLDGGFSRKACFWDFVRHLDRLDAVLLTRLNNSNVCGISSVLRRKRQNAVYPQIGHFFCNVQERKALLSPDGDKDKDPLIINLLEEGHEVVTNLKHLNLTPQSCYRDSDPINLYHKVGHGTLDMYVLNPARESKEVRDFLQKWNNNDCKLFSNVKTGKDFSFPLPNLVSICALLVWHPSNPDDNITRILFPGSTPQGKIFEGLDKLRQLDCIKHPVCSEKSLTPISVKKTKDSVLDKIMPLERKIISDVKKDKSPRITDNKQKSENKPIDSNIKNGTDNGEVEAKVFKKSDSTESDKSATAKPQVEDKVIKSDDKPKPKIEAKPKVDTKPSVRKPDVNKFDRKPKPSVDKKPSPTTPKKTLDTKVNGESKDVKPKTRFSPSSTPAKSAKEANNRKVFESKNKPPPKKEPSKVPEKKESKPERKPISRRPKAMPPIQKPSAGSPVKKVQKPDSIAKKAKLEKEGTTDSSTVSTPSADQENKRDISKLTPEELEQLKAQELADLKEEQEVVQEIEAVFRKGEERETSESELRKIKNISIEEKTDEEYLIVEKEVIETETAEKETKEDETQKHLRDSEESEKQRKLSADLKPEEEVAQIEEPVAQPETGAEDTVKEVPITSPEDKIDSDKKPEDDGKDANEQVNALESQPDEKFSATVESGATTAPTLPEDERIPLDEIKEDIIDQVIEEKYVKEETKEKEIPVIQLPSKTFDTIPKIPPVVGIRLDKQSHIRDIVKTPDEVADLPMHEVADHYVDYHQDEMKSPKDQADKKKSSEKSEDDGKSGDKQEGPSTGPSKDSSSDVKQEQKEPEKSEEAAKQEADKEMINQTKDEIQAIVDEIIEESKENLELITGEARKPSIGEAKAEEVGEAPQVVAKEIAEVSADKSSEKDIDEGIDEIGEKEKDDTPEDSEELKQNKENIPPKPTDEGKEKPDAKHVEEAKRASVGEITNNLKADEKAPEETKEAASAKISEKEVDDEKASDISDRSEDLKDSDEGIEDITEKDKEIDDDNESGIDLPKLGKETSTVDEIMQKEVKHDVGETVVEDDKLKSAIIDKNAQDKEEHDKKPDELHAKDIPHKNEQKDVHDNKEEVKDEVPKKEEMAETIEKKDIPDKEKETAHVNTKIVDDIKSVIEETSKDAQNNIQSVEETIVEKSSEITESIKVEVDEVSIKSHDVKPVESKPNEPSKDHQRSSDEKDQLAAAVVKDKKKEADDLEQINGAVDSVSELDDGEGGVKVGDSSKSTAEIERNIVEEVEKTTSEVKLISDDVKNVGGAVIEAQQDKAQKQPIKDDEKTQAGAEVFEDEKESDLGTVEEAAGDKETTKEIVEDDVFAKKVVDGAQEVEGADEKVKQGIKESVTGVTESIDVKESIAKVDETLESVSEKVVVEAEKVEDKISTGVSNILGEAKDQIVKEAMGEVKDAVAKVDKKLEDVEDKVKDESKEIVKKVESKIDEAKETVDHVKDTVNETINEVQKIKSDLIEKLESKVETAKTESVATFGDIKDSLASAESKITEEIVDKAKEIQQNLATEIKDVHDCVEKQVESVVDKTEEAIKSGSEKLADDAEDFKAGLSEVAEPILQKVSATKSAASEGVAKELKDISDKVDEKSEAVSDKAKDIMTELSEKLDVIRDDSKNVVETVESSIIDTAKDVAAAASDKSAEFVDDAKKRVQLIEDSVAAKATDLVAQIGEKSEKIVDTVSEETKDLYKKLSDKTKETIEASTKDVNDLKKSVSDKAEDSIKQQQSELNEDIAKVTEEVGHKIDKALEQIAEKTMESHSDKSVKEEIKESLEKLHEKHESVVDSVKEELEKIDHDAKQISDSVSEKVSDGIKDTKDELREKVDEALKGADTVEKLTEFLNEKLDQLDENIKKIETAESAKAKSSEKIPQTSEEVARDDKEVENIFSEDLKDSTINIEIHSVDSPKHAETITMKDSSPDSPVTCKLPGFKEVFVDKADLGRKSPKEREQDVALIVASVAEVLKSEAPLEEFEGKIPLEITSFTTYSPYTTELRETHITTLDSPTEITGTITPIMEDKILEEEEDVDKIAKQDENAKESRKISDLIKNSNELLEATSKMISDIKLARADTASADDTDEKGEVCTVHRMLVTASSEDGGEETVICPPGSITFTKSSESSGRSSPDITQKSISKKSVSEASGDIPNGKDKPEENEQEMDKSKIASDFKDSEKSANGFDEASSSHDEHLADKKELPEEDIFDNKDICEKTQSGRSTPNVPSDARLPSGKSTPDLKEATARKSSIDVSRKASADVSQAIQHESSRMNGVAPDEKMEVSEKMLSEDIPEKKNKLDDDKHISSGKASPDVKLENKDMADNEDLHVKHEVKEDDSEHVDVVEKHETEELTSKKAQDEIKIDNDVSSGKSSPDIKTKVIDSPNKKGDVTSEDLKITPVGSGVSSRKSTPDIHHVSSGKTTPDIKGDLTDTKVSEDVKVGSGVSSRISTPDIHHASSGKSTPDIKGDLTDKKGDITEDVKITPVGSGVSSRKSTPDIHHISLGESLSDSKGDLTDKKSEISEDLKITPVGSGVSSRKSTPDIHAHLDEHLGSGKGTPDKQTTPIQSSPEKSAKDDAPVEHISHQTKEISTSVAQEIKSSESKIELGTKGVKETLDETVSLVTETDVKTTTVSKVEVSEIKEKVSEKSEIVTKEISSSGGAKGSVSEEISNLQSANVYKELMEETIESSFSKEVGPILNGDVLHETYEDIVDSARKGSVDSVKTGELSIKSADKTASGLSTPDIKEMHSGKSSPDIRDSRKSSVMSIASDVKEVDSRKHSITSENTKTSSVLSGKSTPDMKEDVISASRKASQVSLESQQVVGKNEVYDTDIKTSIESFINAERNAPLVVDGKSVVSIVTSDEHGVAGPSTDISPTKIDSTLSGKSTPDIADVEKFKEMQEILKHEKHIPGSSTPPTVPVSPIIKDVSADSKPSKEMDLHSILPQEDDLQKLPTPIDAANESDDDVASSPMSVTSQVGHSPYEFDPARKLSAMDQMNTSYYGALPSEEPEVDFHKAMQEHRDARGESLVKADVTTSSLASTEGASSIRSDDAKPDLMTSSFIGVELPSSSDKEEKKDPISSWGKPLGLPSPAPINDNKGTPKKDKKLPVNVSVKNKLNDDRKRSESPKKQKKINPVYVDLTYVPHHGNSYYTYVDFFKRVRARYYVFSGIEPSKEVYNALLEAKQVWEDKDLEVTIIPTYDTDVLGYWVAENEELLTKHKIDLSPSASRCTINLQDHETSCSAYRLEF